MPNRFYRSNQVDDMSRLFIDSGINSLVTKALMRFLKEYLTSLAMFCAFVVALYFAYTFVIKYCSFSTGSIQSDPTIPQITALASLGSIFILVVLKGILYSQAENSHIRLLCTDSIVRFCVSFIASIALLVATIYALKYICTGWKLYLRVFLPLSALIAFIYFRSFGSVVILLIAFIGFVVSFTGQFDAALKEFQEEFEKLKNLLKRTVSYYLVFCTITALIQATFIYFAGVVASQSFLSEYDPYSSIFFVFLMFWMIRFFNLLNRMFAASVAQNGDIELKNVIDALKISMPVFALVSFVFASLDILVASINLYIEELKKAQDEKGQPQPNKYWFRIFMLSLAASIIQIISTINSFSTNIGLIARARGLDEAQAKKLCDEKKHIARSSNLSYFYKLIFALFFFLITWYAAGNAFGDLHLITGSFDLQMIFTSIPIIRTALFLNFTVTFCSLFVYGVISSFEMASLMQLISKSEMEDTTF